MKTSILLFVSLLIVEIGSGQAFQPYPERYRRLVQSIAFSPDEKTLYFTLPHKEYLDAQGIQTNDDTPRLAIYRATSKDDAFGEPELLPFSGQFKDYEPTLSPDGNTMFFNSNRPVDGHQPFEKNNIWFSIKRGDTWGQPQYLDGINTHDLEESYPTITRSGELYFIAGREHNGDIQYAVYRSKFQNGAATGITKVDNIDQPQGTGDPWVSPDGAYLIYTKFDGEKWEETCDLYISINRNGDWTQPEALKELNGEGPDFAVAISPGEEWIYYRKNYSFIKIPWKPVLKNYLPLD